MLHALFFLCAGSCGDGPTSLDELGHKVSGLVFPVRLGLLLARFRPPLSAGGIVLAGDSLVFARKNARCLIPRFLSASRSGWLGLMRNFGGFWRWVGGREACIDKKNSDGRTSAAQRRVGGAGGKIVEIGAKTKKNIERTSATSSESSSAE